MTNASIAVTRVDLTSPFLQYISLNISDVSPADPVENTPISIGFSLFNKLDRPLSGQVTSASGASARVTNLAVGETFNGTVSGLAPTAGPASLVSIDFFDDDNRLGGEFPQPNVSASEQIGVAATYTVAMDSLLIKVRCHALENDNINGSVEAKLGDTPLDNLDDPTDHSGQRSFILGDVSPLTLTPIRIQFAPFTSLAGSSPPLNLTSAFTISFGSHGEDVLHKILDLASHSAADFLDVFYPTASAAWKAIDEAVQQLHDLIFAFCGRAIADKVEVRSDQLLSLTSATGTYTQPKDYITSPPQGRGWPCQFAEHVVTFTITRTSFKP